MNKLIEYLKNVRVEMAKVSWPSRQEVTSATILVIVLSAAVSLFVFVCDRILNLVIGSLL